MIAVNFHTKFGSEFETSVRTVKSGGIDLVALRVQSDGDMVDLFFHDPEDAYNLLKAVNDVLDIFDGEPAP